LEYFKGLIVVDKLNYFVDFIDTSDAGIISWTDKDIRIEDYNKEYFEFHK